MRYCLMMFALSAGLFAADCDVVFSFTAAGQSVVFNNKGKACANYQVSYFSSGFSAVSLQFESAPDAGTTPGTWVAFAGTTLTGANPMTATTQQTATFSGVYPWVRVRLVSKTGTGQITGRMLGIQLTSASIGFENSFTVNLFGRFTPIVATDWTSVDLGTGTRTDYAQSVGLWSALGGGTRTKICRSIAAAPWTITGAWRLYPQNSNPTNNRLGISFGVRQVSTSEEEFLRSNMSLATGGDTPLQSDIIYTTDGAWGGITARNSLNGANLSCPILWTRITDNGSTRTYRMSCNGSDFTDWTNNGFLVTAGAAYNAIVPDQACFGVSSSNGNYRAGGELLSWTIQ